MDYDQNRLDYVNNYSEFSEKLVLNGDLLRVLSEHVIFGKYHNLYKQGDDDKPLSDESKKSIILLEFTNTRNRCNELLKILSKCNQRELAKEIQVYNKSPGRIRYTDADYDIDVDPAMDIKGSTKGNLVSMTYMMTHKPRGKAIIINNVKDLVTKESKRFEHIFKQLLFDVELEYNLTSGQIRDKLFKVRNEITTDGIRPLPQCLIVMFISHGENEGIIGHDETNVPFRDIVGYFNHDKITFPKLFFFTCCRKMTGQNQCVLTNSRSQATYQFVSCSQGYLTFVEDSKEYTHFGRAFSESIAQYACRYDLIEIMTRTNKELQRKFKNIDGYFTPGLNFVGFLNKLYFNPHWSE